MKKRALFAGLVLLTLLLSGCGGDPALLAPTETPAPTAPPQQAPAVEAQGPLADAARALLAPYEAPVRLAAEQSPALLTYAIPGDLISQMALDAAEAGAAAQDGRYQFTWSQSGRHTYTANALHIAQIEAASALTPDPHATGEPVMDNQQMGDFSASGGGVFDRTRAYDVAENLSEGAAEITETLNGALSLHELFSFSTEDGCLYFVDALLDQAVDLDGLVATSRYLAAAGVLRPDGLEIIEFSVPNRDQIPAASAASWQALQGSVTPLSRLTVEGGRVHAQP